jgi:glycosyltransferase involved in cell wall biosynthesis
MYEDARVGVLIPAYNEATQIIGVLASLPAFVDDVVVINDASTDDTVQVVRGRQVDDPRIVLIDIPENRGVGGALAAGYRWARDAGLDVVVTVDGDGQMDPAEMASLIDPIILGDADYTKGNRLLDADQWQEIPRVRFLGNAVLSLLTKPTSGYWAVADSQSGYTAAGTWALTHIDWDAVYPRYGRPNDVLVLANIADCRVADVPIRAIYGVGERSSMKIAKVTFAIAALLFRRFWFRIFHKYVLRDFHPLVFFYLLAVVTGALAAGLTVRLVALTISAGNVPDMTALATAFLWITALNSTFFAMWMDMQANAHLNASPSIARRRREQMAPPSRSRGGVSAVESITPRSSDVSAS